MPQPVVLNLELPDDLAGLRLPAGVEDRLHSLLDRQDQGTPLTPEQQREAAGLVELSELLSLLRLRAERALRDR